VQGAHVDYLCDRDGPHDNAEKNAAANNADGAWIKSVAFPRIRFAIFNCWNVHDRLDVLGNLRGPHLRRLA
jgi:hypothetical protein